jgi:tetratricopeptide (TPR) repeat protein
LDSEKEQYYFDLGAEYLLHLTFDAAIEAFRTGSQKFPASARLYVGRGLAQFAVRQYADAADAFLSALEADPSSPDAFLAWNDLPQFVVAAEWGKIQPRLRRLAERYPENSQVVFCYGAALLHQAVSSDRTDGLDRAQSLLEKAVRLNRRLVLAHLELGNLFAHRKQYSNAIVSFREAIRLDPDSEVAHYKLAQIYRDLNELALAEQQLRLYQKLSQNHRDQMAQTRSTIRQFVLARPSAETAATESKR